MRDEQGWKTLFGENEGKKKKRDEKDEGKPS